MTKHTRSKQGYTLIEALVAMGIFVLIAVLGTGIFTSILRAQTRTLQQQGTAQELRFFQDVISRDIRGAKTVSCEDPDTTTAIPTSLMLVEDGSTDEIKYFFDATTTPHKIMKTADGTTSALTDINISSMQIFCNDIGNSNAFVTISVLAEGSPTPYQVSIAPRNGVLK